MVKARIRMPRTGNHATIEIKRAKFKHWHEYGTHPESDVAFRRALYERTVDWLPKILEPPNLFQK